MNHLALLSSRVDAGALFVKDDVSVLLRNLSNLARDTAKNNEIRRHVNPSLSLVQAVASQAERAFTEASRHSPRSKIFRYQNRTTPLSNYHATAGRDGPFA